MKYQEEQDRKLKQHIEEFNVFKTTFTNGAVIQLFQIVRVLECHCGFLPSVRCTKNDQY